MLQIILEEECECFIKEVQVGKWFGAFRILIKLYVYFYVAILLKQKINISTCMVRLTHTFEATHKKKSWEIYRILTNISKSLLI